jgi:ribosome-binding factor A
MFFCCLGVLESWSLGVRDAQTPGHTDTQTIYFVPLPIKLKAMESTRQKKVSRLIQKELAEIFIKKGSELSHGSLISVTKVRISPDLSLAKVFISIFPAKNQEEVMKTVQEHSTRIRYDLGQKIRSQLRIVPEIAYQIDDSLDYIDNIDRLLKS